MLHMLFRTGLVTLLIAALLSTTAIAQVVSLKADAPKRYEVKRGDSLWFIATQFLNDPWMWPQLWQANKQVGNPHLLYPGDVIELLDGRAGIRLQPRLRILALQQPIPFMPLEQVDVFLNRDVMIDRPEFEDALYTVHIAGDRRLAVQGDQLEVLGDLTPDVTRYAIYRELEEVRDPLTRQHLGFRARALGSARLINSTNRLPQLEITESFEEIKVGDRLLPFIDSPFGDGFQPKVPEQPLHGTLLQGLSGQELISRNQAVMLNMGSDKLKPGALLEIIAPGRRLRNHATGEVIFAAENRKGVVMVYRVFENTSFALVMSSKEPMLSGDIFRRAEMH
ncbi:MAG TPA: LysM domain-containing protein [Marinospirillum sp.]|uniref:LysM peptidoglycan-binding domain-containing protein n=1 Tax=Marinospirillum sp. TaxID=2183934 RepID=UPI002B466F05|nr:LysM domain-containing protein [Marinospirillum sp.]HKM16019.1 LysM domain-containing protein [Marinospirillum sp.]